MISFFGFLLAAIAAWRAIGRAKSGFLVDFARLLDGPEIVDGFGNLLIKRSFLKGEFRGRKIVIMLQNGRGEYSARIVVSMETQSAATMEAYEFANYRSDRDGERALFALEVKHEFRLRHENGCLKALWVPALVTPLTFPPLFDPSKWQGVLETMDTLAGSLEKRAA
jgi:hypothetical protein